jgi:feruloyl esterase
MSPDLERFRSRGGKLIQYHGLADPVVPPADSVAYYERVIAHRTGEGSSSSTKERAVRETGEFHRLFLVPGLEHCRGGAGPTSFDMQSALEAWSSGAWRPRASRRGSS